MVRAIPPISDLSTLFSVTAIVLDLTNDSMFHKIQTNPVGTSFGNLCDKI